MAKHVLTWLSVHRLNPHHPDWYYGPPELLSFTWNAEGKITK
jgi:hypothetical protein